MGDLDALALQFVCGYCGTRPEEWCVTARPYSRPAGQPTTWLHESRLAPIREAWRLGFYDGQHAALSDVVATLDAAHRHEFWAERLGAPALLPSVWVPLREWLTRRRDQARG